MYDASSMPDWMDYVPTPQPVSSIAKAAIAINFFILFIHYIVNTKILCVDCFAFITAERQFILSSVSE